MAKSNMGSPVLSATYVVGYHCMGMSEHEPRVPPCTEVVVCPSVLGQKKSSGLMALLI